MMKNNKLDLLNNDYKKIFIIGSIIGAITFVVIYGFRILDVTYVDWLLMGGDLTQHYLGWEFFRKSNWNFPVGLINGLNYPDKVSIMYTDSIPLFALIFKILSSILPEKFQYFGMFGIISFMLQGGIAGIIIRKITNNKIFALVAIPIFTFSTTIIQRMFEHTALGGQWLILLSILVCVFRNEITTFKMNVIVWCSILLITINIHMYFIPMVGIIMFMYLINFGIKNRDWKKPMAIFMLGMMVVLLDMYLLGAFYGYSNSSFSGSGLGYYNANINSLINPMDTSTYLSGSSIFMKNLPLATDGQYEGYAFLGMGGLLLIVINVIGYIQQKVKDNKTKNIFNITKAEFNLIIITIITFFVISFGLNITLNQYTLINIPMPSIIIQLYSVFRASGRFMWVVMYLILFISIVLLHKLYDRRVASILMSICIVFQIGDYSRMIVWKHKVFSEDKIYNSQLESNVWGAIAQGKENLILLNTSRDMKIEEYYKYAIYASNNELTVNDFYFARKDDESIKANKDIFYKEILNGNASMKNIYIFPNIPSIQDVKEKLNFYCIDGVIVGIKDNIDFKEDENNTKLNLKEVVPIEFENNKYITKGKDTKNGRIIEPGGISYGPYYTLEDGTYALTITGENIKSLDYDICFNNAQDFVNIINIEKYDDCVEIIFKSNTKIENVEFRAKNSTDAVSTKKDIILSKI